jgi:hypothetical protein
MSLRPWALKGDLQGVSRLKSKPLSIMLSYKEIAFKNKELSKQKDLENITTSICI